MVYKFDSLEGIWAELYSICKEMQMYHFQTQSCPPTTEVLETKATWRPTSMNRLFVINTMVSIKMTFPEVCGNILIPYVSVKHLLISYLHHSFAQQTLLFQTLQR